MLIKYPRTYHLPESPGATSDDKILYDLSDLLGHSVIVTEKMDGENTTMTSKCIHARSLDSIDHPSRHYVKGIWGNIKHEIPDRFRICGENCYAKHSIPYSNLEDYFLVFNIWNDETCLSWEETVDWCNLLGLKTVPVITEVKSLTSSNLNIIVETVSQLSSVEGFVVRRSESFNINQFKTHVAKWVRANHVQTDQHWMYQPIIKNELKNV